MNSLPRILHQHLVFGGRIRTLSGQLAAVLPDEGTVLDVGCGDGQIASLIMAAVPGARITGLEVAARPSCSIACETFDGRVLPYEDNAFDTCMFVDVLHHADDGEQLLREGVRVARRHVVIKDHLSENGFDSFVLRFMDWVGNRPYGVRLPYRFLGRSQWDALFIRLGVTTSFWNDRVSLYPFPANLIFGRGLHFIARLDKG